MQRPDGDPGALAWLVALVSMALPWIGGALALVGGSKLSRGEAAGGWWLGAGVALVIIDVAIDFVWAHPAFAKSDQPDLNRPAAQLVGRVLVVAEAIDGGGARCASATRCGPRKAPTWRPAPRSA